MRVSQSWSRAVTFGGPAPWVAPTEDIDPDDLAKVLAFLDGQSRIDLAVWVGRAFPVHVQHQVACRLVGRRPGARELRTLWWGIGQTLQTRCYLEFPTRAQMREIDVVGERLWRRAGPPPPDGDPLAFRFAYEPVGVPSEVLERVASVGEQFPAISRISAYRFTLLKGPAMVRTGVSVIIDYGDDRPPQGAGPLPALRDVLTSYLHAAGENAVSMSVGHVPKGVRARTLYRRPTEGGAP